MLPCLNDQHIPVVYYLTCTGVNEIRFCLVTWTFADVIADLVVPPIFGPPRKVSPEGAKWSKSQCALRWKLGGTYPGYRGAFVAAFGVEAGLEAAAAGLSTLHALLVLKGQPGKGGIGSLATLQSSWICDREFVCNVPAIVIIPSHDMP